MYQTHVRQLFQTAKGKLLVKQVVENVTPFVPSRNETLAYLSATTHIMYISERAQVTLVHP